MTDLLLVAGPSGSKSTFIGGLYHHIKGRDGVSVVYEMLTGDGTEFEENVLRRMGQLWKYPGQTTQSYAVRFHIQAPSSFRKDMSVTFMDIPGEQQREAVSDLEEGEIDREDVRQRYRSQVQERLDNDDPLRTDQDEWKILYKYTYLKCHRVIFLLNINKLVHESEDPIYGPPLLEKVAENKRNCALIPTAVDILEYDPSGVELGTSLGELFLGYFASKTKMADEELLRTLQQQVNSAVSPKANNVITAARINDNINVFGTAVPAEDPDDPDNMNLVRDGRSFETHGFDRVVEWLER